jgi:hypothetical protein
MSWIPANGLRLGSGRAIGPDPRPKPALRTPDFAARRLEPRERVPAGLAAPDGLPRQFSAPGHPEHHHQPVRAHDHQQQEND